MLNAKLVVVGGDAKAGEFKLKLPTVIGRGKESGLSIPHALVSRAHTEVFEREGRLIVKDLGSLNGTFVNRTKIDGEQVLQPNQLLTLGNITFRAVYEPGPTDNGDDQHGQGPDFFSDVDSRSAISEIDSFEPDESDSFGRLSEINSRVFNAQARGPKKTDLPTEPVKPQTTGPRVRPTPLPASNAQPIADPPNPAPSQADPAPKRPSPDLKIDTGLPHTPAVSSIDGLPIASEHPLSSIDPIGDVPETEAVDLANIRIDDEHPKPVVDPSRLGSFIRRLPK